MVSVSIVQKSISQISSTLPPGLVAIFVGATSGIGEAALKKFTTYSFQPKAYFVGRSQAAADHISAELKALNPGGEYIFIKADVSLIRIVDEVCKQIKRKEKFVNILFLSAGVPSMDRSVTPENLHLLASLNYYSRLRFITSLLSLLKPAPSLRRIVTVGGGGFEGPLDPTDFPALLIPLPSLRGHLSSLVTLGLEAVAETAPEVSFVHDFPGSVRTPFLDRLPEEMLKTITFVPLGECGERHLYLATSARFPALTGGSDGVPLGEGDGVAVGSNGEVGSGMYSVGADCESGSTEVRELLAGLRGKGMVKQVWRHTEEEFRRIVESNEGAQV